ncbi:MAG: hypothetical protein DHS20C19_00490 [Acidimicrobiales bacterium]|nr:MAG: hypothetical protein DHS20C19_00490 [Acidimicrobiales bacterium]
MAGHVHTVSSVGDAGRVKGQARQLRDPSGAVDNEVGLDGGLGSGSFDGDSLP